MKLLLFSDVHCDLGAVGSLVTMAEREGVDAVVGAGDFGTCREGTVEVVRALRSCGKDSVLVPGNAESDEELRRAAMGWLGARVLHGNGCEIGGVWFWGLGGGVPVTPFGSWSWDHTEEEAQRLLGGCPEGAVLVTHSPPRGMCDADSLGAALGSEAVRSFVDAMRPRLVVCGHIHASWGAREKFGVTEVVNAGPGGVVVEVA